MRLLYCTSIAFSHKLANLVQVHAMAKEFQKQLREDFYLGVNYKNTDDQSIKIICFNSRRSYILAWKYLKFIKNNGIDQVYCREAILLFFIIIFNKLFFHRRIQAAYEIHALPLGGLLSRLIEGLLARGVDSFIFITHNLKNAYVKKFWCPEKKICVSPDAVDLAIFDITLSKELARTALGLPQDKKIICYTGRFKTMGMDKGISIILKALTMLDDDVFFIAVGGNKQDIAEYEAEAARLGVASKTKLFGNVEQATLAIYQKASDALLMPFPHNEHYAYFMSPLKLFEYMASQRPIIASDLPAVREVLNDGNALLAPPDNPKELARGIKNIMADKTLAEEISRQAYADAHNYTWEKRVCDILSFIRRRTSLSI